MPTIIDSLIVTLGLDSKDLNSKSTAAGKKLKELEGEAANTEKSVKKVGATSKEASGGFSELTRAAGGFLALIGGTVAIKAFISDFISANAQLDRFSKNIGVDVSTISAWSQANEQLGGSASGLQGTLDMLSKAQTELKLTGQSSLIPYLTSLGVSLADVNGKARPVDDLLLSLAGSFSKMDRTTANNMGRMIGIDQGTMNLLLLGRKELELTIARQRESTAVTKAQAEEASKLQTQLVATRQKFTALGNALVMQAAPAIEKILDLFFRLGNWVLQNSEVIGDFLKVVAVGLGAIALAALPIDVVVIAIAALAAGIALLWQDYQTWKRGGDSLIDWGKWEPGITAATKGIKVLGEVAKETFHALGGIASIAKNLLNGNNAAAGAALGKMLGRDVDSPEMVKKLEAYNTGPKTGTPSYMQSYFQKRGYTPAQAAGITANILTESKGNIHASGDSGHAYGLAQWHEDRQAKFKEFAGHDIRLSTLDEQLSFVVHEMAKKGTEERAGNELRATNNAAEAGARVSKYYERPLDAEGNMKLRGDLAAQLFKTAPAVANGDYSRSLQGSGTYAQSLYGIPGATASVGAPATSAPVSSDSSRTVTIGKIDIHTQATDAEGISQELGDTLGSYLFTSQANTGLAY